MQFINPELEAILSQQESEVEIRDQNSFHIGRVPPDAAIREIRRAPYVGVGNATRVRFIRRTRARFPLNGGSITTRRLQGENGPLGDQRRIREHRPEPQVHACGK